MALELYLEDSSVFRRASGAGFGDALPATADVTHLQRLQDWAERYSKALRSGTDAVLLEIGREMFSWLDHGKALDAWMQGKERRMVIQTSSQNDPDLAAALMAAPWELVADRTGYLAQDTALLSIAREAHGRGETAPPTYRDISLLFMASSPIGEGALDYEREEAIILKPTRPKTLVRNPLQLQVEESGAMEFLAETVRLEGPFDVLHISCHGDIQTDGSGRSVPVLYLEDVEGNPDPVSVDKLTTELHEMPKLLFVSACRTAERGKGGGLPLPDGFRRDGTAGEFNRDSGAELDSGPDLADPFVRQISRFTPNVIGWDGSVYDTEASTFAAELYGQLARGMTVPDAAAFARRELLRLRDASQGGNDGAHWHLARVYVGPDGGGPICDPRHGECWYMGWATSANRALRHASPTG